MLTEFLSKQVILIITFYKYIAIKLLKDMLSNIRLSASNSEVLKNRSVTFSLSFFFLAFKHITVHDTSNHN